MRSTNPCRRSQILAAEVVAAAVPCLRSRRSPLPSKILTAAEVSALEESPNLPCRRSGAAEATSLAADVVIRCRRSSLPEIRVMNIVASVYRRLNIKELITNVPLYSNASDASGEGLSLMFRRWATKKTAGSTKNGRDSKPKNLGVKKFGGQRVIPGNIIVRQRGTRFHPGNYVGLGKDHTLYALEEGCVKFEKHKLTGRKWVHVEPKAGHKLHPAYAEGTTQLKTNSHGRATVYLGFPCLVAGSSTPLALTDSHISSQVLKMVEFA